MTVALLVLAALVGCVPLCRYGNLGWPIVLVGLAVLWLLEDKPLEGPVLLVLTPGHGVTMSDLVSPAALVAAAVLRYRRRTAQLTDSSRSDSTARSSGEDLPR